MKKKSLFYTTLALILSSCATQEPIQNTAQRNSSVTPHPAEFSVLWHQTSGEYKALCHQAFYLAKKRLDNIRNSEDGEVYDQPAIVMDIDETVLDNSPYMAQLVLDNRSFSDETWREWTAMEKATFVPGALEFLNYARDKDIPVYFISNRDVSELENTVNNMNRLGYKARAEYFLFKTNNRSKEPRRRQVEDEKDIVMLIGDNLRDFSDVFSEMNISRADDNYSDYMRFIGNKFIILPNAMYGDWLYNENSDSGLGGDEVTPTGVNSRRTKLKGL